MYEYHLPNQEYQDTLFFVIFKNFAKNKTLFSTVFFSFFTRDNHAD